MKQVVILYKYVPQYRQAFFNLLRVKLAEGNVALKLIHGDPSPREALKNDAVYPAWAKHIKNYLLAVGPERTLVYQPVLTLSCRADLVIVEQANRLIVNLLLVACNKLGLCRLAYWGHGKNFQVEEPFLVRNLKSFLARNVQWWFAYNVSSASIVQALGFPADRITHVMNTIDNGALKRDLDSIADSELNEFRALYGLTGADVCIYVGGMYDLKRLDFLLEASCAIKERLPSFQLMFVGSGDEQQRVEEFVTKHDWCLFHGACFGREKALRLKSAELILMPGLVGLAIVDSFVAKVPIVTTDVVFHSPEIEYLRSGHNGVMVSPADDVSTYAAAVVGLLTDDEARERLREGCAEAAGMYSMENMVDRFAQGVHKALAL